MLAGRIIVWVIDYGGKVCGIQSNITYNGIVAIANEYYTQIYIHSYVQSYVQIIKLVKQIKSCVHRTKINQHACTRKQTQIKSATAPVKCQIFVKGFVNRLKINVTINYTRCLFFVGFLKEYYNYKTYSAVNYSKDSSVSFQ